MDGFGAGLKMRSKMLRNRKPSLQFPPRLTGHWPAQPKLFCSSDEFHLQLPQSNQLHTLQWCIITVRGWITPAFAALLTCTRTREHFAYRSPDRLHNCSCKPKCSKVIIKKKTSRTWYCSTSVQILTGSAPARSVAQPQDECKLQGSHEDHASCGCLLVSYITTLPITSAVVQICSADTNRTFPQFLFQQNLLLSNLEGRRKKN